MTSSLRGTPRLSAVPPSQNTAPVAEFRCLFTHDLRRKQKRWQDGYLKFHTFNSRVMVYDTSRNFLGDTYWKDSNELQEGDELTLDKGVMVEVADAMGITQTDLTPLFEKRSPQAKTVSTKLPPRPSLAATALPRPGAQLRHKSLNTLLGGSKGPIGKSAPMRSPYEVRKEKENEWTGDRASKRQKTAHAPVELVSSSPTRAPEPQARKDVPLWARTSDAKKAPATPKPVPRTSTAITLDSEPDRISSDVTLPTSPVMPQSRPRPSTSSTAVSRPEVRNARPVETPVRPPHKIKLPTSKPKETPPPIPRTSSPPVSVSNRLANIDFALQPRDNGARVSSPPSSPAPEPKKKGKPLRLALTAKRSMLLCESLPAQRSRSNSEASAAAPAEKPRKKRRSKGKPTTEPAVFDPVPWPSDDKEAPIGLSVQDAKGDIDDEVVFVTAKTRQEYPTARPKSTTGKSAKPKASPPIIPQASDDMEIMHGLMDQELLPKEPPAAPPVPRTSTVQSNKQVAPCRIPFQDDSDDDDAFDPPTHQPTTTTRQAVASIAKKTPKSKQIPSAAPPPTVSKPTTPLPTHHPPLIDAQPRNKRSVSPRKLPLSTGSIGRKKAKKTTPETSTSPKARSSLTSNSNGPLMTTTELSNQLLREKHVSLEDDPIESTQQEPRTKGIGNASSSRGFRRVRSENDKDKCNRPPASGIPSTAAQWEAKNMPKDRTGTLTSGEPKETGTTAPTVLVKQKPKSGLAALVRKTDPRKKFQRSQSLTLQTNLGSREATPDIPSPVVDTDIGPWSTEAFDLFGWMPPGIGSPLVGGEEEKEEEDSGIGMLVDKS